MKIKVMTIFGTRPEAIKMGPVVKELEKYSEQIESIVCVTAQHREMLDQVLEVFKITPQFDLNIMRHGQTLTELTSRILLELDTVIKEVKPDLILVHGDTTTTMVSSLAAFYNFVKIGHVEAGLRTYNKNSPFPEEVNRNITGIVADYHFAPTEVSKQNLLNEGKNESSIYVTGNTAIDALKTTIKADYYNEYIKWAEDSKLILLTSHRRENIGQPMENIFKAVQRVVVDREDVKVLFPIHKNPIIRELAEKHINSDRVRLIEPLDVIEFHNILNSSYIILTDSGGIQEEAPSLGKPVLVLRDTTERPEGVAAGTLKLVGTKEEDIYNNIMSLLSSDTEYNTMSNVKNPYGDGFAAKRIVEVILNTFKERY